MSHQNAICVRVIFLFSMSNRNLLLCGSNNYYVFDCAVLGTKATLFLYFEGKKMFKSKWLCKRCPIYIPKVMGYWCYFLKA